MRHMRFPRGHGFRVLWILTPVLMFTSTPSASEPERPCTAWPGEVDPLPTTRDADPFVARWAALRSEELKRLASAVEQENPAEAYRLWVHVSCLDPDSIAARRIQELRPRVLIAERPRPRAPEPPLPQVDVARLPPDAERARDASPAREPEPSVEAFRQLDARLAETEGILRQARFRAVLEASQRLRSELLALQDQPGSRQRRARVEVMAATALVALGRSESAAQSFDRALDADPDLILDPASTPPKIQRLLEEVRAQRGESPP